MIPPLSTMAPLATDLVRLSAGLGRHLGVNDAGLDWIVELTVQKSNDPVGNRACILKEIGDVALSVLNLAVLVAPQSVPALDAWLGSGHRHTAAVVAWCDQHYPDEGVGKRLANLLEESVELALVVGVSGDALRAAISTPPKPTDDNPLLALLALLGPIANALDTRVAAALDWVMADNEQKSLEASRLRHLRKASLGLTDPLLPP